MKSQNSAFLVQNINNFNVQYLLELSILYVHNRRFPSDVVANAATCLAFAIDSEVYFILALKTGFFTYFKYFQPSVDQTPSTVLRETELRLRDFTGKNVKDEWDREREVMLTLIDLFLVVRICFIVLFKYSYNSRPAMKITIFIANTAHLVETT